MYIFYKLIDMSYPIHDGWLLNFDYLYSYFHGKTYCFYMKKRVIIRLQC